MRKLFLFMMVTIDGYFEGVNYDLSWHNVDPEFEQFANKQLSQADIILFGHRTYEMMASFWPTENGQAASPATAKLMNEMPKIVVSHEPLTAAWNNTTVFNAEVVAEIKKLKAQPGKEIALLGSNNLCVSLMQEGLVDEFRIMVNPVVIGKGTVLFAGLEEKIQMKLLRTREFTSGNILNTYTGF